MASSLGRLFNQSPPTRQNLLLDVLLTLPSLLPASQRPAFLSLVTEGLEFSGSSALKQMQLCSVLLMGEEREETLLEYGHRVVESRLEPGESSQVVSEAILLSGHLVRLQGVDYYFSRLRPLLQSRVVSRYFSTWSV